MKRRCLIISCAVTTLVLAASVSAQVLKQIDPTKQADISNKSVQFNDVNFQTLSPGIQSPTTLPLSGQRMDMNSVTLPEVQLNSVQFPVISMKTVPRQNFTAKRAVLPDKVPPQEQLSLIHTKAPIKDRQIRAFMPGGEEELKEQLHDIPPPQPAEKTQSPTSSGK